MTLNSRYSQHARRALAQARLLAQDFQHDAVDTDHLVVGIMREKSSLGYQVLHELGVDERRAELEVRVLHSLIDPLKVTLKLTEALKRVLTRSEEESTWFGHHYVGTEHLLLALARNREGGASELLRTLKISPDQIRRRVKLLLNNGVTELSLETAKRVARLSELSRRVLNAAEQLAAQSDSHQHTVGLSHLLVVLARERRSMASRLLRTAELDITALEQTLISAPMADRLVQTALLEDVIDSAVNFADQLGTHYTGTDHMLLALTQHDYGAQLLRTYGVDPEKLRKALLRELSPSEVSDP